MTTNTEDNDWKTHGEDINGDSEGDIEVVVEDSAEDGDEDKTVSKFEKPSRAEDRIRQLAREKNQERAEKLALVDKLSEAQREMEELRRGRTTDNRRNAESAATQIAEMIEAKKKALKVAKNEGDLDTEITLTEEISDLIVQRRVAAAQKDKFSQEETNANSQKEEKKSAPKQEAKPSREELPEKMQEWLADNTWFDEDPALQAATIKYAEQLINDGYDQSSQEFFDAIDDKMARFGVKGSDSVQSKNKTNSSSSANSDVKPRQTVPGASRTPASKKGRVTLTREEVQTAERLGISKERYAARKKAHEEAGNGWVEINRK